MWVLVAYFGGFVIHSVMAGSHGRLKVNDYYVVNCYCLFSVRILVS